MAEDLVGAMEGARLGDDDFFRKGTRLSKAGETGASSDRANRATQDQVLDPRTRMILFQMLNRGVFDELRGCLSTGKEANVYRAVGERQLAVKVYKTAILAFKDRERYVAGEFRFQQGYSRSNPRKMVRLWAEKETRNLKRIYKSDIPVPKPLHLNHHVLVMEFLGTDEGWPSPKLKDADIEPDSYPGLYLQLVAYMRILYNECRLVHADLSEYNVLYHEQKLWIIDVSQSVEHDHPSSLDFLRMDIKNVNDFFARNGVAVFSERTLFKFITTPAARGSGHETVLQLIEQLETLPDEPSESRAEDDAVFRRIYIPRNLSEVVDVDRDTERVRAGDRNLIYQDLLSTPIQVDGNHESNSESGSGSDSESGVESDSESDDDDDVWQDGWDARHTGDTRKFTDRSANKERKQLVKEEMRAKRATKLRKKDKKKLAAKARTKKTKH